jgi:hypothetical protein
MLRYAILAGAVAGLGVALIVRELIPSHPALGAALTRLHASPLRGDDRPPLLVDDRRSTMGGTRSGRGCGSWPSTPGCACRAASWT